MSAHPTTPRDRPEGVVTLHRRRNSVTAPIWGASWRRPDDVGEVCTVLLVVGVRDALRSLPRGGRCGFVRGPARRAPQAPGYLSLLRVSLLGGHSLFVCVGDTVSMGFLVRSKSKNEMHFMKLLLTRRTPLSYRQVPSPGITGVAPSLTPMMRYIGCYVHCVRGSAIHCLRFLPFKCRAR